MAKILLPPSEGKAEGGNPKIPWDPMSGTFGAALGHYRQEVIDALIRAKGGSQTLLGVGGKHLSRSQDANRSLRGAPSLPAWQRYTGVVWDHLDLASLTSAQRTRALASILIVSGLAGLIRADDPLPDYRLKIGAKLSPMGNIAKWWQPDITECLALHSQNDVVIDLLPNEHRAAIDWTCIPSAVRIDLVAKGGGRVGGHNAKAAKGELARHLLLTLNSSTSIEKSLKNFKHAEYTARIAK